MPGQGFLLPAYLGSAQDLLTAAARHAATLAAWHKRRPHTETLNRHMEDTVQKIYTDTKLEGRRPGGGLERGLENLVVRQSIRSLDLAKFRAGGNELPEVEGDVPGSPAPQLRAGKLPPRGVRKQVLQSQTSGGLATMEGSRAVKVPQA